MKLTLLFLSKYKDKKYKLTSFRICIAEAQEITVKKGLLKGTSGAAIAKLTMDISQKFEHAYNLVKGVHKQII